MQTMEKKTATMILSEDVPPLALEDFKKYLCASARAYLKAPKTIFMNSTQSKAINTLLKQYLADKQLNILMMVLTAQKEGVESQIHFIMDLKSIQEGKAVMCFKHLDFGLDHRKRGFLRYFRKKLHILNLGVVGLDFNPLQIARSYIGKFSPFLILGFGVGLFDLWIWVQIQIFGF